MDRATDLIGKYLLTGWVLTDTVCRTTSCNVPLLRSKDSSIWFCVLCEEPGNAPINSSQNYIHTDSLQKETLKIVDDTLNSQNLKNTIPNCDKINMSIDERREQSRRASQSIGQYLLQGWALIDEVCPNDTCFGVPLLRSRDKKKYCVICQHHYINESDLDHSKYKITRDLTPQTSIQPSVFEEEKHKSYVKDSEIMASTFFCNNNETFVTAQKTIISKIEKLSVLLQDTIDISEVKNICDAMKSCAQALEALGSLDRKI